MDRYGKYFIRNLLWLEDDFCSYYVQNDAWDRQEILDVEFVRFTWEENTAHWMVQCANWDAYNTISRIRSFLVEDCLTQYMVHRMDDRQVLSSAAQELVMGMYRVVIEPKVGWAVRLDPETQEPLQPVSVKGAPDIDGLLNGLRVELDGLVAAQKQSYQQWEAKLATMSDAEKAALY